MIPFLIDISVLLEDFKTKSDRQVAILCRNFVFMMLNSVMLPLTQEASIQEFISSMGKSEIIQIPEKLAQQLTNQYLYFL